jgi:Xaa-Pro aminopeptidase/Xaa-Pro dipeptidase
VVVTSPLEQERVREVGREVEIVVAKKWKHVPKLILKHIGRDKALVDDDSALRGRKGVKLDAGVFLEARRVKDEVEVERIQKASRGQDKIYEELPRVMKPGKTEWEVAAEVMKLATEQELVPAFSDSAMSPIIVASGENGALPHSELTNRKLRSGDFVVADIFFRHAGYHTDQTRTFAIGSASAEMKKNYETVLEAQERAVDAVRTGVACEDVHLEAVRGLKKGGVDKFLNHSVGHGVGIDIHELPPISRGVKGRLKKNDVITVEPGIYLKGKYGIRIEDTMVVGNKTRLLTKYTKEIVTCG